jgi:hypothetical protein
VNKSDLAKQLSIVRRMTDDLRKDTDALNEKLIWLEEQVEEHD